MCLLVGVGATRTVGATGSTDGSTGVGVIWIGMGSDNGGVTVMDSVSPLFSSSLLSSFTSALTWALFSL